MQREQRLKQFLVFCHRTSILEQWQRAASRLGLTLLPWPGCGEDAALADGLLLTYQSAGRQPQLLRDALQAWPEQGVLAIADEAHHLGVDPDDPSAAAWGTDVPATDGIDATAARPDRHPVSS